MGNGRRKQTEREECLMLLCVECHQKAHTKKELNYLLKQKAQTELLKIYDLCEVRKITGGKIYI